MMIKHRFEHLLIQIERYFNVVVSIHLSWLFLSKSFSFFFIIEKYLLDFIRSLGLLNYIHIWHDNTGSGDSASWFLKYLLVRDLQTMKKSYFICQNWLAVEKSDGRVCGVLHFWSYNLFSNLDWTCFTCGGWISKAWIFIFIIKTSVS